MATYQNVSNLHPSLINSRLVSYNVAYSANLHSRDVLVPENGSHGGSEYNCYAAYGPLMLHFVFGRPRELHEHHVVRCLEGEDIIGQFR